MLILTRAPGQSVRVGLHTITVLGVFERRGCRVLIDGPDGKVNCSIYPGNGATFGTGTLFGGKTTRQGHATLGFSFPRDVKIVRTELEPC